MNVFLFGAGASYGSGRVEPCPPPLGGDLYSALKRIYPMTWGSFESSLQVKFIDNFEYGMAELIEKNSHAIAPLMQQMAIFFSRFGLSPSHDNLYKKLLKKLKSKSLLATTFLTTLNYECICEIAAFHEGIPIDYFGKEENESAKIWKIHGSCNFKLEGIQVTRDVSYGMGAIFNGSGIQIIEPSEVAKIYKGNTSLYPSMCLYAKDKPLAIAEGLIKNFQNEWTEKIKNADKIFVIGVRPLVEDVHIWQPIADSLGSLYFVGDEVEFEKWTSKNRSSKTNEFIGKYWKESETKIYSKF
jgi:hypothetical protein